MARHTIILLLLLSVACNRPADRKRNHPELAPDTTRAAQPESFDLRVRKYEDPKRQAWQDPKFVIEALGNLNDKVIADIGAGTGYFTFQLAAPARKVIAIDIEQRFLNYIEDRKGEMYDRSLAGKIETRLTTPQHPSLADGEAEVVLMVNTITYIKDRQQYLTTLKQGIAGQGRLVIVDYKLGKMPVGPDEEAKVGAAEVVAALKSAGFVVDKVDNESLQYQYLIKAHKP